MTDETTPTQPSLATFLQGPANTPAADARKPAAPTNLPATPTDDGTLIAPELQLELPPAAVEPIKAERHDAQPVEKEAAVAAADSSVVSEGMGIESPAIVRGPAEEDEDEEEAGQVAAAVAPSFARDNRTQAAPAADTPRWQWGLVLALALLLGLQIIIADRARLAADAGTRPLVSGLCTVLRCSLPPWHEPGAFSMLSRDIRPVPGQAGALQVQASFRNDARWAQAWPALRLSLSDADGRVIGRRTLQPAEYLGPAADPQARLEPGQSAQVSFRLREPAAATVAFSFEFQ
ncbi:MAG: DUF3426 domain-containing protein [Stenotrophomonas sp.]